MAAALRGLLVVALLLAGFALKSVIVAPPAADHSLFNTNRAAERLQRILGDERPHPVDSPGDDLVRGRLLAELRAIGLMPEVHEATDCSSIPKTRYVSCSHVRNVIARIPSRSAGPQLLLNAHYDSTPTGPGAGDDGLGVAVLLEVGAILKASPPARPVTLLFNEGEEFGLNGAHAFVHHDPLARDVNSLINIDVRGVTGPALMYETSDPNAAAITVFEHATNRPFANSISTDFARLIPNTTDVVFFKPLRWTLLNYGIIGNETRYHSPGDTVAALDRRSLGHVGRDVLAATEEMAAKSDPSMMGSGRRVFTDIAGRGFIQLPLSVAAVLLGLLLLASILLARREKALARPLAAVFAMTIGGIAVAAFVGFILTLLRPGDFWRAYPIVAYLAVYATLLLSMTVVAARVGRGVERRRLRIAAWLMILILGSILSLLLPGATIFFLIAPALSLLGIALSNRAPALAASLNLAAIVVQFLMFSELLAFIEMLLIDGPLWAVAPFGALAAVPALIEIDQRSLRPATIMLLFASLGFSAAALAMPRASLERPLGFGIEYFRDVPDNTANWAIATKRAPLPAHYPGDWHTGTLHYNGSRRWIMPAPVVQTPAASARILANEPTGSGRRVRLMLSLGGADSFTIRLPANAKLLALGLPAASLPIPDKGEPQKPLLRCTGRSCEGLQVEMILGNREPLKAELFSTKFGVPPEGRPFERARPANAVPQYAPDQTITRTIMKL